MSQSDILEIVSIVEDLSPMTFIWKTLLNCSVGEDSWESLRLQGDPTSPF